MPFPESPRVIYDRNPLEQVICQLRFPPILRIDSEVPADFQDRIRNEYPLFRENKASEITAGLPPEIAKILATRELPFRSGGTAYSFISNDDLWIVGLTREFLSLSAIQYKRWESFREHLMLPLQSLIDVYLPTYFSRIGLRYRNVIRRSALGLQEANWSELLKPQIVGELASSEVSLSVEHAARELIIRLNDNGGRVRIQHGLAKDKELNEQCYLIDSDFYTEQRTEVNNAIEILNHFNQLSGRLFQWCILDRLNNAMGPRYI